MPDAKWEVDELQSIVEFPDVRRDTVTHQLYLGHELVGDVIVADVDGSGRGGVAAVDQTADTSDGGLSEDDWLEVVVHVVHDGSTAVQRLRHQLNRPHRHCNDNEHHFIHRYTRHARWFSSSGSFSSSSCCCCCWCCIFTVRYTTPLISYKSSVALQKGSSLSADLKLSILCVWFRRESGDEFQVIVPATENTRWSNLLQRRRGMSDDWRCWQLEVELSCHVRIDSSQSD